MKRILLTATAAAALAAAVTLPARADVFVLGEIFYNKNKTVDIDVNKFKDVDINVQVLTEGFTAAEADAVVNQRSEYGYVDLSNDGFDPLTATLGRSVNENLGITQLNQDVGYNVNQSNVVSASVSRAAVFSNSLSAVEQVNQFGVAHIQQANMYASINRSVNANSGITMVNQNAGVINNQNNTVSLGVGDTAGAVALSEADLGQFNSGNKVDAFITHKTSTLRGSVNNNEGITTVNQSSGMFNNQTTNISIAGTTALNHQTQ